MMWSQALLTVAVERINLALGRRSLRLPGTASSWKIITSFAVCRGGASVQGAFVVPGIQAHYKLRTKMCIYALSLPKVQQTDAK